jgi:hypothetical protein
MQTRSPASDCRGIDDASVPDYPTRFSEGLQPVSSSIEVVQRTEQEYDIDQVVAEIERAGIAQRSVHSLAVASPHLVDVMRDEVAMDHLVARVD